MILFRTLASDGDGTLTHRGRMAEATFDSLTRLKESGRKLVLVTGELAWRKWPGFPTSICSTWSWRRMVPSSTAPPR